MTIAARALDRDTQVASSARGALLSELAAYPKPGLVSHVDAGSHRDMDAGTFQAAIDAITPSFVALARAGARGAEMHELRQIGLCAEAAMRAVTGGVNTHRGAIFGLGLLVAAAGAGAISLGTHVRRTWGPHIVAGPVPVDHPGALVRRRYGAGGAPAEAAAGFPTLYETGLPALERAVDRRSVAAHVEVCMALIAAGGDTNLLHRGGIEGARFARESARAFLDEGGTCASRWQERAEAMHRNFVARNLSPGGSADLLTMTLFVAEIEGGNS